MINHYGSTKSFDDIGRLLAGSAGLFRSVDDRPKLLRILGAEAWTDAEVAQVREILAR